MYRAFKKKKEGWGGDENKRTQREKNYYKGSVAELVNLAGGVRRLSWRVAYFTAWTPVFDSGFNPRAALTLANLPQKVFFSQS